MGRKRDSLIFGAVCFKCSWVALASLALALPQTLTTDRRSNATGHFRGGDAVVLLAVGRTALHITLSSRKALTRQRTKKTGKCRLGSSTDTDDSAFLMTQRDDWVKWLLLTKLKKKKTTPWMQGGSYGSALSQPGRWLASKLRQTNVFLKVLIEC